MGRDDDLDTLHKTLQQNSSVAISTVTGMGGIGKTELALQYAQRYWEEFYPGGALWLQAREADLGVQILTFARVQMQLNPSEKEELAEQIDYCWRNWRGEGNVLVILDDVTDYQSVEPYLPPNLPRFKVIVTTRVQNLAQSFAALDLEVLKEPAALELLASLIGETRLNREEDAAKNLCAWLGYLPLGLELVGQYLAQRQDLSLVKMQQRLEKKRLEHKSLEEPTSQTTAQQGVKAAFELSWQDLATEARELACLLSLFALAPIPWETVEACLPEEDEEELEDIRDGVLVQLSLLQRVETGWFQLHSLLREFLRGKLEALEVADGLKRKYCQVMIRVSKQVPQSPTIQDIKGLTPVVPHLTETAKTWVDCVEDENLMWAFLGLVFYYNGQGLYSLAEPWFQVCLSTVRARLGEEHPDVATSLNNLAELYRSQGRYEAAEPLYLEALELRKKLLGEEHPDVATSLNNLAELYRSQGRYEAAEPLYLEALDLKKKLLGEEHPHVASSLNNLAGLYYSQGRYEAAEPLYLEALDLYKKLLGEEHPSVATSLNNLAGLYKSQGRYEAAEPLYLEALELRKKLLGEEHPDVATSLNNLALLYESQGRYEAAEPLYVQAVGILLQRLGQNHPNTQTVLNNFYQFLVKVTREGQRSRLSNHPWTVLMLEQIDKGDGVTG
ncbi:tetratricopeptide repeat protein [Lusitaniella coriacea]|uniref:tetratricopeptide repeat protein n=1 Tax=Lusitaniella coriacea TaxID=1983105 RepID=UPI003CF1CD92